VRSLGSSPSGIVIAGGYYALCSPGVYLIDERMAEDGMRVAPRHPRNRMTLSALRYCREHGIPGVAVDPMSSVTLPEEARLSGYPAFERCGVYYAFPERLAFSSACASCGLDPDSARGITVHLGDEVSVAAHDGPRVVATSNPVACEGPFGFTSAGTTPAVSFITWLESGGGGSSRDEILELLKARSGAFAYAGVTSRRELLREIMRGNRDAVRAVGSMAYQVSKEIGRAMAALKGRAEFIALTGPGASLDLLVKGIEERVAKWSPVVRVLHDDCMRALVREGLAAITTKHYLRYPEEKRS
jgi:butyrate kinase